MADVKINDLRCLPRAQRGHRGHDGNTGPAGATGPTGPVGPSGPAGADNPGAFVQQLQTARIQDAINGNVDLIVIDPNPETLLAANLNVASSNTFRRVFTTKLVNGSGALHEWAQFVPTLTPLESVADPDVAPPTIGGAPQFSDGFLVVEITLDTDAGVTKTYVPGDTVSVQIKVSVLGDLLGYAIASATKTYLVA